MQYNVPNNKENLLFYILIALHVIPIWLFNNFSTADSWTHTYNTFLLNEYYFGNFEDYYANFFQHNPKLFEPNYFINYLQLIIAKVFSYWATDKIVLSLYVVLFPLSIHYAISAINKKSTFIALLSIPLIYNTAMFLGMYSFMLSLPVAFFLIGFYFRHAGNWTLKSAFIFSLLATFLYICHIITFGLTFTGLGAFSLAYLFYYWKSGTLDKNIITNRLIIPIIAALPALILIALFLLDRDSSTEPPDISDSLPLPIRRFKEFALMYYFRIANGALLFVMPLVALMGSMVGYFLYSRWKEKSFKGYDLLFVAFIVEFIVFLFIPELQVSTADGKSSGGFMDERLAPYVFSFLLLLISVMDYSKLQKKVIMGITSVLTIGLLITNTMYFKQVDEQLDEFFSGDHLYEPHSTLLGITGRTGGIKPDGNKITEYFTLPFAHASSKTCLNKQLIYLEDVEPNFNYFAIQYRENTNPYRVMNSPNMINPKLNIMSYEMKTGISIDYIAVWLGRKAFKENTLIMKDNMQAIYAQLDNPDGQYEKIFTSENELMEIYKHK